MFTKFYCMFDTFRHFRYCFFKFNSDWGQPEESVYLILMLLFGSWQVEKEDLDSQSLLACFALRYPIHLLGKQLKNVELQQQW